MYRVEGVSLQDRSRSCEVRCDQEEQKIPSLLALSARQKLLLLLQIFCYSRNFVLYFVDTRNDGPLVSWSWRVSFLPISLLNYRLLHTMLELTSFSDQSGAKDAPNISTDPHQHT